MLLQDTYDSFVRSGAALPEDKRGRFKEVKAELAQLSLQFSQNNIKETNDFVLHLARREDLAGLPESQIEQAAAAAAERQLEGWVFTLHAPSFGPFMQYAENRALRERMYRAYMTRCAHDNAQNNFEICKKLVNLRMEMAQLLGFPCYADYVLKKRMAQTPERVYNLLEELKTHYLAPARREVEAVEQLAKAKEGLILSSCRGTSPTMPIF